MSSIRSVSHVPTPNPLKANRPPIPQTKPTLTTDTIAYYQLLLKKFGYNMGDHKGNSTPKAILAIKMYQKDVGIPQTGYFDLATRLSIDKELLIFYQELLVELGFDIEKTNGTYNLQTKIALREYQVKFGLDITERLDAVTIRALDADFNGINNTFIYFKHQEVVDPIDVNPPIIEKLVNLNICQKENEDSRLRYEIGDIHQYLISCLRAKCWK